MSEHVFCPVSQNDRMLVRHRLFIFTSLEKEFYRMLLTVSKLVVMIRLTECYGRKLRSSYIVTVSFSLVP